MQRIYFPFSILILAMFLAGCAPKAVAQAERVKALENPTQTNLSETPTPIASATVEFVPHDPPASCPITVPQNPIFAPPAPYDSMGYEGEFDYSVVNRDGALEHTLDEVSQIIENERRKQEGGVGHPA